MCREIPWHIFRPFWMTSPSPKKLHKFSSPSLSMKGMHNFKVTVMHADELPLLNSMTYAGTTMTTFGFTKYANSQSHTSPSPLLFNYRYIAVMRKFCFCTYVGMINFSLSFLYVLINGDSPGSLNNLNNICQLIKITSSRILLSSEMTKQNILPMTNRS